VGGKGPNLARVVAHGPLLVHFFDFAQLNSVRAMPYVVAWSERYREHGLSTLGVHTPRFEFTAPAEAVEASLAGLGIEWPVAIDSQRLMWRDYGSEGWPSLFLWSRGGALRWYHLGEGDYEQTEAAITDALDEAARAPGGEADEVAEKSDWPAPLEPLRPTDAAGATVIAPTPELFPGGSPQTPWTPSGEQPALSVPYEGGGAFLAATGDGEVALSVDGAPRDPVAVHGPGLYQLVADSEHLRHELELEPDEGVAVHSIQFSPAPAP
jgi:hypothetical protein